MNTRFVSMLIGTAMAASLLAAAPAYANINQKTSASVAPAPLGLQYFCAQNRSQCRAGGAAQVRLTQDLLGLLQSVNIDVNKSIRPAREAADTWSLNPTSGDCEDYVVTKRAALIRQGVSSGALRIAFTHTRRGQPHAVLVVRTSQGDYVLDNLNNAVKTLQASGYTIRSMSSPDPRRWVAG